MTFAAAIYSASHHETSHLGKYTSMLNLFSLQVI
uniref:Uncharacterized protein n=1 Tax=Anguilla anguilla TaxID=7936 RepID=A0A0E9SFU8_ANGAN